MNHWYSSDHEKFDREMDAGLAATKLPIAKVRPDVSQPEDTGEEYGDLRPALERMIEFKYGAVLVDCEWFAGAGRTGRVSILHSVEMMPNAAIDDRIGSIERQAALKIADALFNHNVVEIHKSQ